MKKILIAAVAFTVSTGAFAQQKMDKKTDSTMEIDMKKDCVMMMDGKMMMMMDGKTMAMDKDMKMGNGATVMTNGKVKMKGGKTMSMKDGDCIYMDGKMSNIKMDKKMPSKM